ncbi:MAG: IS200/IS605 family transposase [Caldilineaceae bacterium]|nr:IS200/IS605 family transposase [Caldilineaceae bacterium]
MPFWRSYAHLIWGTKERKAFIVPPIERPLRAQIVSKAGELGCYVYAINGMPDHIHVVLTIPPKISAADVVKSLKGSSSHFVNHVLRPSSFHFAWQRGYGFLTLGQTQLPKAIAYVENQEEHHRSGTWNIWLERHDELDDGPEAETDSPHVVRESQVVYMADDSADFPF